MIWDTRWAIAGSASGCCHLSGGGLYVQGPSPDDVIFDYVGLADNRMGLHSRPRRKPALFVKLLQGRVAAGAEVDSTEGDLATLRADYLPMLVASPCHSKGQEELRL